MKNQLALITGLLFTASAFAQSNPIDTEKQITAQTGVTLSLLQQVRSEFNKNLGTMSFKVSDYREQAPVFLKNLENAESEFERGLENEVLPELRTFLDQYNSTFQSKTIGQSQRELLLARLQAEKGPLEQKLSARYAAIVRKLLTSIAGPLLTKASGQEIVVKKTLRCDAEVTLHFGNGFSSKGCLNKQKRDYDHVIKIDDKVITLDRNHYPIDDLGLKKVVELALDWKSADSRYQDDYKELFSQIRVALLSNADDRNFYRVHDFPFISQGCRSIACITFRAADVKNFLMNTENKVNRRMEYRLPHLTQGNIFFVLEPTPNQDVEFAMRQLLRVDYPTENSSLPFDTAH